MHLRNSHIHQKFQCENWRSRESGLDTLQFEIEQNLQDFNLKNVSECLQITERTFYITHLFLAFIRFTS